MPLNFSGVDIKNVIFMPGNVEIKELYCGGVKVWNSGNICTYYANGTRYAIEYGEGQSVLSPSGFTPYLSDATFLGWSTSSSSATVQQSLVMGDNPISLYPVYRYNNVKIPDTGWYNSNGGHLTVLDISPVTLFNADPSKYYAVSGTIYAMLNVFFKDRIGTMVLDLCGNQITLGESRGEAYGFNINYEYRSYNLGNSSYVCTVKVNNPDGSAGDCSFNMSGITLYGRTVVHV